jgi:hypothetical protein
LAEILQLISKKIPYKSLLGSDIVVEPANVNVHKTLSQIEHLISLRGRKGLKLSSRQPVKFNAVGCS